MAKIQISVEALRENSARLSAQIEELRNLNARLETLLLRIEGSWQGQASLVYIQMMRQHMARAVRMIDLLTEYKKYVDGAREQFSTLDAASASRIRNSF